MIKRLLFLPILFVFTVGANAQTIPKSIDKQVAPKTTKPVPKTTPKENRVIELPEMVYITGGSFNMGSDKSRVEEKPVHQVTISSFYMGKYEITQSQWESVMGNKPSYFKDCPNCPVENVSWDAVQQYLKKINAKSGKHYRLPTEAEWEYAARGGQNYDYAGSNNIADIAWVGGNSLSQTHPVGQKSANGFGLFDMTGNVWEWCNDKFGKYTKDPSTDPTGPVSGDYKISRGGGWSTAGSSCWVVYRRVESASLSDLNLGFRIAISE